MCERDWGPGMAWKSPRGDWLLVEVFGSLVKHRPFDGLRPPGTIGDGSQQNFRVLRWA